MTTTYIYKFYPDWTIKTEEENISIEYQESVLSNDIYNIIQLAETFKAYSGNRLYLKKRYNIDNIIVCVAQKDNEVFICLEKYDLKIFLDKVEASYFARIIDKIVNKIDLPTVKKVSFS